MLFTNAINVFLAKTYTNRVFFTTKHTPITPHVPLTLREYRNEKAALIQLLQDLRLTYIFSTNQCQIEHFHIDICDAGKLDLRRLSGTRTLIVKLACT